MHYIHRLIQGFATTYDILIFFPYLTFWNDSTKSHQSPPMLDCVIELSKVPMDEIVVNASKAPLNVLRKVKKKTKTFRDVLQASRVWIYVTLSRILYYYLLKALHRRYIRFLSLEVQNLCQVEEHSLTQNVVCLVEEHTCESWHRKPALSLRGTAFQEVGVTYSKLALITWSSAFWLRDPSASLRLLSDTENSEKPQKVYLSKLKSDVGNHEWVRWGHMYTPYPL